MMDMFNFVMYCIGAIFSFFEVPILGIPVYVYIMSAAIMFAFAAFIVGKR